MMMEKKASLTVTILVIDDEKDVLKSLKDTLASESFIVKTAMSGEEGIKAAKREKPNLILLDLRLPDMDGYDVCREIRKASETAHIPIIMVSTRSRDTEKIVGLEIGADDYVTKPFNVNELLARIRAVLRRQLSQEKKDRLQSQIFKQDSLAVDLETRRVSVDAKLVNLTRKEFDLLALLISRPGKAFNRTFLLESVWGHSYDSLIGTVSTHIKTLRQKLGLAGKYIETVTGIGYRWSELPGDDNNS